jgi:hypothetical protein
MDKGKLTSIISKLEAAIRNNPNAGNIDQLRASLKAKRAMLASKGGESAMNRKKRRITEAVGSTNPTAKEPVFKSRRFKSLKDMLESDVKRAAKKAKN